MGKILRTADNLFDMPKGAFIRNRVYVYINTSNRYVSPDMKKDQGTRGYTGHDSLCIGVIADSSNAACGKFYANQTFRLRSAGTELPDPPEFADSIAIGLHAFIAEASIQWNLAEDLAAVFGEENAQLILDLAFYMVSAETAVMQHFPAWAREHALFSEGIRNDTYIGSFLKNEITISKIAAFREKWAERSIGDGRIYLCYDSTNVNSQAEGVFIVQKGHAKDDAALNQVNTDVFLQ